jgi:hypothetical protein
MLRLYISEKDSYLLDFQYLNKTLILRNVRTTPTGVNQYIVPLHNLIFLYDQ